MVFDFRENNLSINKALYALNCWCSIELRNIENIKMEAKRLLAKKTSTWIKANYDINIVFLNASVVPIP